MRWIENEREIYVNKILFIFATPLIFIFLQFEDIYLKFIFIDFTCNHSVTSIVEVVLVHARDFVLPTTHIKYWDLAISHWHTLLFTSNGKHASASIFTSNHFYVASVSCAVIRIQSNGWTKKKISLDSCNCRFDIQFANQCWFVKPIFSCFSVQKHHWRFRFFVDYIV